MAQIIFEGDDVEIEVADGTDIQSAIAQADTEFDFGCRNGECGTCIVEVLEGMENLSPVNEAEEVTLMDDERERGIRLACQLKVISGTVKFRAAEDEL